MTADDPLGAGPPRADGEPFGRANNPPPPPPRDDAPACFAAMERAVEALPVRELGAPVLPCERPSFELTLSGEDGLPLGNARYVLAVPGEAARSGTLDAQGVARFDDLELDPAAWSIVAELAWSLDEPVYHVTLVAREPDAAAPPPAVTEQLSARVDLPLGWLRR